MEADELASRLTDLAFEEAVGVLQMICRSPEDHQFYEARQKFLHDEQARLLAARQEGRDEGELAGKVRLLKELLGTSPATVPELIALGKDALMIRFSDLQQRLCAPES